MPSVADTERQYYLDAVGRTDPINLSNADLEREFYLMSVTNPDSSLSNADLERLYYAQSMGITGPYNGSISDLKQQKDNRTNLLTANQASVETDLTGFQGYVAGTTLSHSIVQSAHGNASLLMAYGGAPSGGGMSTIPSIPATPGKVYTGVASIKTVSGSRGFYVELDFVGGGAFQSVQFMATSSTWTEMRLIVTAPVGTTAMNLHVRPWAINVFEDIYIDKIGIWEGTGGSWAMPGEPIPDPKVNNLLTANQASIETDATGWVAFMLLGTVARSTAWSAHGSASLAGTHAGGLVLQSATNIPVTVGKTYTVMFTVRAATVARQARANIRWLNASSGFISDSNGAYSPTSTSVDTTVSYTTVAPAGAAFAMVVLDPGTGGVDGEVHYVDKFGFWEGSGGNWSMPIVTNLLTANQASGTDTLGNMTGFDDGAGKIYISSSSSWVIQGSKSLKWTIQDPMYPSIWVQNISGNAAADVRVTAGKTYTYTISAKLDGLTTYNRNNLQALIDWFDDSNVTKGQISGIFDGNGVMKVVAVAPVGSTKVTLRFGIIGPTAIVGEIVYLDKFGFWQGSGGDWVMPPPIKSYNILTPNQASIETDTNGFANEVSTIVRSTAAASHGSSSLLITSTGTGIFDAFVSGILGIIPGKTYTVSADFLKAVGNRSYRIDITFVTSADVFVSSFSGNVVVDPTVWITSKISVVAPPTSSKALIYLLGLPTGNVGDAFYLDRIGIWQGSGGNWEMPGTPIIVDSP